MRNLNQDNITQAVIARFVNTPDPRLKAIMTSLVQHLHAFAREVMLTEHEWLLGIEFLTRTGHIICPARRDGDQSEVRATLNKPSHFALARRCWRRGVLAPTGD
jgi:hypothetical protein